MSTSEDTTRTLIELSRGDERAADKLAPVVYEKLRALAQQYMQRERPDHTLQATALLNEAYMKLIDQSKVDWKSKTHFVAVAAEMMRRILVDHARRHAAAKHGGGRVKIPLEGDPAAPEGQRAIDVIALDEALEELKKLDSRQARVVELRFFGGLTVKEAAYALGVSDRTVDNEWCFARAWLRRRLAG